MTTGRINQVASYPTTRSYCGNAPHRRASRPHPTNDRPTGRASERANGRLTSRRTNERAHSRRTTRRPERTHCARRRLRRTRSDSRREGTVRPSGRPGLETCFRRERLRQRQTRASERANERAPVPEARWPLRRGAARSPHVASERVGAAHVRASRGRTDRPTDRAVGRTTNAYDPGRRRGTPDTHAHSDRPPRALSAPYIIVSTLELWPKYIL